MPGPSNTLLIEGSFTELAEELAQYLDAVSKTESGGIHTDITPILESIREHEHTDGDADSATIQEQKDEVLKKIVGNAAVLNSAPEKEFTAAYNLLIYLSNQSQMRDGLLSRLCKYLSEEPVTGSTQFGPSLAISTLSTIFNTLPVTSDARYHVFLAILAVIRATSSTQAFDALIPQLETNMPNWVSTWHVDEDDIRTLYMAIADVADAAERTDLSYQYLLKALETISPQNASEPESLSLAKRTLISALINPSVTDFTPLTASDAIQALRTSDNTLVDLLEIFSSDDYAAYTEFLSKTSLSSLSIPDSASEILSNKIRLLTLAALAASSHTRSVSYSEIATALQVPAEDVEMWVIDTIRAGLVEGKLSQLKQEFLVQRVTYRVFGDKQWAEIQGRLMVWRRSLESVLGVVRAERERFAREGPGASYGEESQQQERGGGGQGGGRQNGFGGGDNRRGGGGGGGRRGQQREPREPREPRQVDFVGGGD